MADPDLFAPPDSAWSVSVVAFTRDYRGSRVGFVDVRLDPPGLVIRRLSVLTQGGTRWVNPPAAPLIDVRGHALRDRHDKIIHEQVFAFASRTERQAFSDRIVAAVLDFDPSAFDVEERS